MATDEASLRSWGGTFAVGLAIPVAALVAAILVFATAPLSAGLAVGLVAALVPWALVAGEVRVRPWLMAVAGVGLPGLVLVVYEAPGAIFLALLAVAWLAATGESLAAEITATVVTVVGLPILITLVEGGDWSEEREAFVFFATGALITWFFGRVLRRERQLVTALSEAQDRLNAAAAAEERQRIAHDVHDVVGHSLTVMLLNVAGARRVLPGDPDKAAEALDRAEQAGRDSLQSVRAIVGLLRTPHEAKTEAPQPGAADIVGLVRTAAAAGLPVRAEVADDLGAVDPYAGLAAFRLVQEAISNVEHHAPAADVVVSVSVTGGGDRLSVSVRNGPGRHAPSPSPPAVRRTGPGGTGLDGLRQRLAALGGTLSAGPDGGGWVVEGTIPLQRAGRADAEADR
jgi:signal transduction histidine kinase